MNKRILTSFTLTVLIGCGGGGVDTKTTIQPDSQTPNTPSTAVTQSTTIPDLNVVNFAAERLTIEVPNDLIGRVAVNVLAVEADTERTLYTRQVTPGEEFSLDTNISFLTEKIIVRYFAYDASTGNAEVRTLEREI